MTEVIKEYAQAIFALACEEERSEEIMSALKDVKKVFDDNPEYIEYLSSYAIPKNERLEGIEKAFAGNTDEYILNLLLLLCEKKHIEEFGELVAEYKALLRFSENLCRAVITSARALSDDEKKAICEKLEKVTGKKVIPKYITDESIIGGVIVNVDGKVIDSSLKSKLKEIKEVINK